MWNAKGEEGNVGSRTKIFKYMTRSVFSSVEVPEPARPIDFCVVRQWTGRFIAVAITLYVIAGLCRAFIVVTEDNPGIKRCTALDWWWLEPAVRLCGIK